MSRETRRVPESWEHPRDGKGHLIPLHKAFPYSPAEIEEGLRDGWLTDDPPHYGIGVAPDWPEDERTHYQMYETTTEGTPISPVLASPEMVAHWCAANGAGACGGSTASYEAWLCVARGSPAPTAAVVPGRGMVSGVEEQYASARKEADHGRDS